MALKRETENDILDRILSGFEGFKVKTRENLQISIFEKEREEKLKFLTVGMSGDVEEEVIDLVSDIEDDDLWSQEEMESLKALEAIETIEREFYARKEREKTSEREQRSERRRTKMMLRQKIDEQRRILSAIEKTKKKTEKKSVKKTPIAKSSERTKTKSPKSSPVQNCCVCLTEPVNVTLRPCGHHLCRTCAGKVSDCPLCRVKISKLSPGLMALDTEEVAKLKRKQLKRSKVKLSLTSKVKKRKKQQGKMGNIRNFFRPS